MKSGSAREKICMIEDTKLVNKQSADATVTCSICGARAYDPASVCCPVQLSGSG